MSSTIGRPWGLATASACALALASLAAAQQPDRILVPGRLLLPESITSSADGAVYVGSIAEGAIYRAPPGEAEAEVFIASHSAGLQSVFGVFADDGAATLWACSGPLAFGPPLPNAPPAMPSTLQSFDLATGETKASYELPTEGAACNDIAVGDDGTVYATDTQNMEVVRLPVGGVELEVWSPAGAFGPPGGVLDGIAIVGDRVVVNTLATGKLFGVEIAADGSAGAVVDYALDRSIERPDGMRSFGSDGVLVVESGAGRLSRVVFDHAAGAGKVTTVEEGFVSPVSVTVVGETAYVLEGQFGAMGAAPGAVVPPIYAIGVEVGAP
jgi:hypothetical protein